MTKAISVEVDRFRDRPIEGDYPILIVDALYEKVRVDGRVVNEAIMVVCGVNCDGNREVLAVEAMPEESKETYLWLFRKLQNRGLKSPKLVISDAHKGLTTAITEGLLGASWQRCKVHFMRNILAHVSKKNKADFANELKSIWLSVDAEEARLKARKLMDKHQKSSPAAIKCLKDGLEDSLTFYAFPEVDHRKISSTNMLERLNREIRRRTRVVTIFPNIDAYLRLMTTFILDYTECWKTGKAYIQMEAIQTLLK